MTPTRYPSARIAWYAMAVFFLAQIVATMDRGILSFVVEPVRHDLGATDVQISLLQGLAFAIFYATVGVPLGIGADIVSRRRLLIAGIVVWSLATILSGFTRGFGEMFACRLFVGLGEATLGPCAVSMIGDLFPPAKRGRPMSFYLFGGTVSSGMAIMLIGGFMQMSPATRAVIPFVGDMVAWRLTFMICGVLGMIVAAMLVAMPEVERTGVVVARRGLGIVQAGRYFAARRTLFAPLYVAVGFWATGNAAIVAWSVTYMVRHFDVDLSFIGQRLGALNMAMAVVGSLFAGIVLTAIIRRGGIRGKLRLTPLLPLLTIPGGLIVLAPDIRVALLLAAIPCLILPLYGSTILSTLSDLVPANMRGVSVALYAFCGTMIGATFGPLLVAVVTQHVLHDTRLVGLSIMLVSTPALLVSSLVFRHCRPAMLKLETVDADFRQTLVGNSDRRDHEPTAS